MKTKQEIKYRISILKLLDQSTIVKSRIKVLQWVLNNSTTKIQTQKPMNKQQIINDIEIIIEALSNGELIDAHKMLIDIREDIKISSLIQDC